MTDSTPDSNASERCADCKWDSPAPVHHDRTLDFYHPFRSAIGNITCPDCGQVYHSGHIDCSCDKSHPSGPCGRVASDTGAERTCGHVMTAGNTCGITSDDHPDEDAIGHPFQPGQPERTAQHEWEPASGEHGQYVGDEICLNKCGAMVSNGQGDCPATRSGATPDGEREECVWDAVQRAMPYFDGVHPGAPARNYPAISDMGELLAKAVAEPPAPAAEVGKYGEPWSYDGNYIVDRDGNNILRGNQYSEVWKHIVSVVNAAALVGK